MATVTKDEIWRIIVNSISELLENQGQTPVPITPESALNRDLGISSVETVHLFLVLEDRLEQPLEFEKLALNNGEYRTELTVGELCDFVAASCESAGSSGVASV
jgi:acyl carrier protein